MTNAKKLNQTLSINLLISSVVWASVILACSFTLGDSNKEIVYILLSGFFIEFLRVTSYTKTLKKDFEEGENGVN